MSEVATCPHKKCVKDEMNFGLEILNLFHWPVACTVVTLVRKNLKAWPFHQNYKNILLEKYTLQDVFYFFFCTL